MQNKSMEIYEMLFEANRTDIRDYKRDRLELQTKAITYCDELLFYIEMSHDLNILNAKSMEYWYRIGVEFFLHPVYDGYFHLRY